MVTLERIVTPSEDLLLEVLTARLRLGHRTWTFVKNATVTKALKRLSANGWLYYKHGVCENTYLVWPTEAGEKELLKHRYVPPIQGGPL